MRVVCDTNHVLLVNLGKVKHWVKGYRSIKNTLKRLPELSGRKEE